MQSEQTATMRFRQTPSLICGIETRGSAGPRVYEIDPLSDPRWAELVMRHPRAAVFHTPAWLEALKRTYGYRPLALTTCEPGRPMENGFVACHIDTWLTGRRLVSLPFSDHCDPLVDNATDLRALTSGLEAKYRSGLRYLEIRPLTSIGLGISALSQSEYTYAFHDLDLRQDLATLHENIHKSTRRNIQRAEREGLVYQEGRSIDLLDIFFRLYVSTRKRLGVPPQPRTWFTNLVACVGEALQIRVAFRERRPIAAILLLTHRNTVTYKYGGSDIRYNNLGATQSLFWRTIQDAKKCGLALLDFGRSEQENSGLITFKDRWGTRRSTLIYSRFTTSPHSMNHYKTGGASWFDLGAKRVMRRLPEGLLIAVGQRIYRHIG
jgi:CelD/BcsL family acetyltransferase involved in cellulose biosynthesis